MNKIFNNLEVYGTGTTNDSNAIKIFNSNSDELFSVSNSGVTSAKTINVESLRLVSQNTRGYLLKSDEQGISSWSSEQSLTLWPLVVQGNRLIDGEVSYVSGFTFEIGDLKYIINGEIYTSTGGTLTLESGSTEDRVDVIYADTSGSIGSISGTPSINPEKPLIDGASQVEVTFVNVSANANSLDFSSYIIYNENSGPPSEWSFGAGGPQSSKIIGNNTSIAYTGTTSIRVSALTSSNDSNYFRLTGSTTFNTNDYAVLQFAIRNIVSNSVNNRIRLRFLNSGGTQNGTSVFMNASNTSGYIQYSPNISSWQLISIPLWRFYLTNTNVQILEVSFTTSNSVANYYFDLFEFREGAASSPPTNSWTTIQADNPSIRLTAQNPNSTLRISGGTNISSTIVSNVTPQTVRLDLDNNITLNGVTATSSMIYSGAYVTRRNVFQGTITNAGVNIVHSLNVNYVVVQVYDNSSPNKLLSGAEIIIIDTNTINVKVSESAVYNVVIIG